MIWIFHFPLIVLNADTRADDSQSMPGTFDFVLKYREPKFATSPRGRNQRSPFTAAGDKRRIL